SVGVDVVDLAVLATGHAGHHRDPPVGDQRADRAGGGGPDLGDPPDGHRLTVHDRVLAAGGEQVGVFTGHADRERAVPVDQPDDVLVDLAGEDHPYHVHGLRRGEPQPR